MNMDQDPDQDQDQELYQLGTKPFGVRNDLQAQVRHEPNACGGWVLDLTLGCSHGCLYCLFSTLERRMFQLMVPGYTGEVVPYKLDEFLAQEKLPPVVYLSYSSDPLQPAAVQSTLAALARFVERGVQVFLVTKGKMVPEVQRLIERSPKSFAVQIGLTSCNPERNRIIEPGVPTYLERLASLRSFAGVAGLHSLAVRIDPMFPLLDDTDENLQRMLDDLAQAGVRQAVVSYLIVTQPLKAELLKHEYVRRSVEQLSERVQTISKRVLFSLPYQRKLDRLMEIQAMCSSRGMAMHTCGCKDEQLKTAGRLAWICHPYRTQGPNGDAPPAGTLKT